MRLVLCFALVWSGCYRSHTRPPAGAPQTDASRPARIDGGARACTHLELGATVTLDEGVSTMAASLPNGDVGVAYVNPGAHAIGVIYERLDAQLHRLSGPVAASDQAWSWALPISLGDQVALAYAVTPDQQSSVLARLSLDGAEVAPPQAISLAPAASLQPSRSGLFWLALARDEGHTMQIVHLARDGTELHSPGAVMLGLYANASALPRPDGGSHVVAYSREGPHGVRHGYVRAQSDDGTLEPERRLGDEDDDAIVPVRLNDELILVRHTSEALLLERTDFSTLARLDQMRQPTYSGWTSAGAIRNHLAVAHVTDGMLQIDDYGSSLTTAERLAMPLTGGLNSQFVLEVPDALIVALSLTNGPSSRPFLVRVECSID